jgi:ectoine hydroxylase-related dioxygenase (phytanoyl-CoA dioxygenase family)
MNAFALDRRTRSQADAPELDAAGWLRHTLPELLNARGAIAAQAVGRLGLPPIEITVAGNRWGLALEGDRLVVDGGGRDDAVAVGMSPAAFSDWINWIVTAERLALTGDIDVDDHAKRVVLAWELVLRWLTDGVPVHRPGAVTFRDRRGEPLDLQRGFGPDDDPADIAHFLREAGYVHLRGWLAAAAMRAISADMDRALPRYREGDERSWWATLGRGERTCVRMRYFVEHSPTTAALLASERWEAVRRALAAGEDLRRAPVEGNIVEALVKPLDVVEGISDVGWHRDCALGGHPYQCSTLVVGISVTPGTADTGLLRVVAGSHRASTLDDPTWPGSDLPVVALPTDVGDITVHLSCTTHEALPPRVAPRKVMYTTFTLPPRQPVIGALAARDVRNEAHRLTSQPPNESRR